MSVVTPLSIVRISRTLEIVGFNDIRSVRYAFNTILMMISSLSCILWDIWNWNFDVIKMIGMSYCKINNYLLLVHSKIVGDTNITIKS